MVNVINKLKAKCRLGFSDDVFKLVKAHLKSTYNNNPIEDFTKLVDCLNHIKDCMPKDHKDFLKLLTMLNNPRQFHAFDVAVQAKKIVGAHDDMTIEKINIYLDS